MRGQIWTQVVAVATIFGLSILGCSIDENYHLFVRDDDPASFEVTASNTNFGGISICRIDDEESALQPMQLQLRSLNEDGTVDISYERKVRIYLLGDDGSTVATEPAVSPRFVAGEVTVESLLISGSITPEVEYVVHVEDENNSSSKGDSSPPFSIDLQLMDHFEVRGIPNLIPPDTDTAFNVTVYAYDQNGNVFPDFDGLVDLNISGNWTITPSQVRFTEGSASVTEGVTINGSGDFDLTATVAEDQPENVTCLGGLGGGEGAGDGGAGGGSDEPGELSCTLSASPVSMLRGTPFTLTLQVSKQTSDGDAYSEFAGNVTFAAVRNTDGNTVTIDPNTAQTIERLSANYSPVTIPNDTGDFTVTAEVTDADSSLTCNCSTQLSARDAVGVFGSFAGTIAEYLTEALPGTSFERVAANQIASIDDINAYTALIVTMPGSDYGSDRYDDAGFATRDLTAAEAAIINEYYLAGNPVMVAHDTMPTDVIAALDRSSDGGTLWGIATASQITFNRDDPTAVPFTLLQQSPWNDNGATVTPFKETYCDGFSLTPGATGVTVVEATYQGTSYALMVATAGDSSPRALIAGESVYHTHGGQSETDETVSPETQWWEEAEQLVINVVGWLLGS